MIQTFWTELAVVMAIGTTIYARPAMLITMR